MDGKLLPGALKRQARRIINRANQHGLSFAKVNGLAGLMAIIDEMAGIRKWVRNTPYKQRL